MRVSVKAAMSADHDCSRLAQLLEFFLRLGCIGCHALNGGVDIAPTLRSEFLIVFKLVGRFAPRFQLGIGLKLERRLLVLDLLAEAFDTSRPRSRISASRSLVLLLL